MQRGVERRSVSFDGALRAPHREPAGQQHVLHHRQIRDEIELLKDEADVLDAKPVTPFERRELGAEDADAALLRRQDSGEQRQQRALAAAARAEEEYALARIDGEALDVKAGRARPRPTEKQGGYFDQRTVGHAPF